jgi:hypothetical protein
MLGANMRIATAIAFAIGTTSLLGGCAIERAATAQQARADVLGRTKAEIIGCAGVPTSSYTEGSTEVLAYQYVGDRKISSTGTVTAQEPGRFSAGGLAISSEGSIQQRQCTANFVIENGRVTRLNYSGRTGGLLTAGEQCAFIVSNCVSR